MSNVEAVLSAQAAQVAAERKAKKDIADYKEFADEKIASAMSDKSTAIRLADVRTKISEKNEKIAWSSLVAILLCCLVANPVFLYDLRDFIIVPVEWALNSMIDYVDWLRKPYYSDNLNGANHLYAYSDGMAWMLRITTPILIIMITVGACYVICQAVRYYQRRWCNLSLRVSLISLGAIIVFGAGIHSLMNINLVLLLLIIQGVYLMVLFYLDDYFETRNRTNYWIKVQRA